MTIISTAVIFPATRDLDVTSGAWIAPQQPATRSRQRTNVGGTRERPRNQVLSAAGDREFPIRSRRAPADCPKSPRPRSSRLA